jgi:hypothetical protein
MMMMMSMMTLVSNDNNDVNHKNGINTIATNLHLWSIGRRQDSSPSSSNLWWKIK